MTDTERDEIRKGKPDHDTRGREGGVMDFIDDDENVKAMRETARTIGLTALLLDVRRSHLAVQTALDRDRARVTKALVLLGEEDKEVIAERLLDVPRRNRQGLRKGTKR